MDKIVCILCGPFLNFNCFCFHYFSRSSLGLKQVLLLALELLQNIYTKGILCFLCERLYCNLYYNVYPLYNLVKTYSLFCLYFFFFGSGLQKYLNEQGFHIVGFGCTTCIGNSGELDESVSSAISENGDNL